MQGLKNIKNVLKCRKTVDFDGFSTFLRQKFLISAFWFRIPLHSIVVLIKIKHKEEVICG